MKPRLIKATYALTALLLGAPAALGANAIDQGAGDAQPSGTPSSLFTSSPGSKSVFSQISDVLIYIVGAVAVIMLIVGGFRYVISQGSSEQVKQAKDTILYAIIGIVVAILAYAVVHFVANNIS
jgi:glucose uptake protein GlcU